MRPEDNLLSRFTFLAVFPFYGHHLYRRCLVDLAPFCENPLFLVFFVGSVVSREEEKFFALVGAHDGAGVANICHIAFKIDQQNYYRARTRPVMRRLFRISRDEKTPFSLQAPRGQRLRRILWKTVLVDDYGVEFVFKIICAEIAPMPIIYREEGADRPRVILWLPFRLHDVHDDRNAVFIIIASDALVRIRRI